MKNHLIIFLCFAIFTISSCLPDNLGLDFFAWEALDLIECQTEYLRPQTELYSFTNIYMVKDSEGEPIANALIQRSFAVYQCDGDIRASSDGLVITDANGIFSETENFSSNYTNDRLFSHAKLTEPVKIAKQSFRTRAKDGSKTFTFIVQQLED